MTAAEFSALLLLATATSFTPGPNTTLSTAIAANRGLRGAMRFVCAVPTGWAGLFVLCALGIGGLVLALPALRWGVLLVGVGYMLWLAWRLAGSRSLGQADARRMQVSFMEGVALQFVNIKAWMLALAIVAGWIAGRPDWLARLALAIVAGWIAGRPDWLARLALVLPVMLAFGFASNFTYALIGSLLRGWLAQGDRLLWFNRVMATALTLTAAWMVWSALAAPPVQAAGAAPAVAAPERRMLRYAAVRDVPVQFSPAVLS